MQQLSHNPPSRCAAPRHSAIPSSHMHTLTEERLSFSAAAQCTTKCFRLLPTGTKVLCLREQDGLTHETYVHWTGRVESPMFARLCKNIKNKIKIKTEGKIRQNFRKQLIFFSGCKELSMESNRTCSPWEKAGLPAADKMGCWETHQCTPHPPPDLWSWTHLWRNREREGWIGRSATWRERQLKRYLEHWGVKGLHGRVNPLQDRRAGAWEDLGRPWGGVSLYSADSLLSHRSLKPNSDVSAVNN